MELENLNTFESQDEFNRKIIANNLNILLSKLSISPMVIDGGWGIGKTIFCKKLINLIKENNTENICIYFDAFKADHTNEPLLAFFASISSFLPGKSVQKFKEITIPILRVITLGIAKAAASHFTGKYADEMMQNIANVAEDSTTSYLNSLFESYTQLEQNIKLLKDKLKEIAEQNPLYIFIDELDRCRPDFSIAMIEIVKHLFELDQIKFIFVANLDQINSALQHKYGLSNPNAKTYLDKFFKYQFKLSPDSKLESVHNSEKHFENKLKESNYEVVKSMVSDRMDFFKRMIVGNNLSLRDVEKLILYIEIDHVLVKNETKYVDNDDLYIRFFCIFLISTNNTAYEEIERGEINGIKLSKILGVDPETLQFNTYLDTNEELANFFLCNSKDHQFTQLINKAKNFQLSINDFRKRFNSHLHRLKLMNELK
ncbi:hypothetical protein DIZ81_13955 [Legionella taurinensis]|uniref:KAP NTPase domain-containing protein n=1 Tax=Legionella taurinensis TaxID=70611 RepID=A0AB38N187_9GAMM|nr:P-loop NTPase fold protein [Legionella taurinensis]MDX1838861.1 P-loop NTPase fold protein [Legionella taurinensis]PUT38549.1 hypothetical protein DB744_13965 [Legionella taurinensis]PUT39317.1 hypothetical protein DB746_13995 [Legionella taurinensis]PUT41041.1 hypothetical protein DB743_13975 [Legionella taurinensis]PUT44471.1 hypothetical protein DB745_13995 [Legionella taurinensis]